MTKQSLIAITLSLAALFSSKTSFALVTELAQCETKNGRFEITIDDNQGTGRERKSEPMAAISDLQTKKIVAWFPVTTRRGTAIGFNPLHYIDTETHGEDFDLAGPSTNIKGYALYSKLESGKSLDDEEVKCSVFGGANLEQ
jgi:hypothetical protein